MKNLDKENLALPDNIFKITRLPKYSVYKGSKTTP